MQPANKLAERKEGKNRIAISGEMCDKITTRRVGIRMAHRISTIAAKPCARRESQAAELNSG
jgi:hypothetical protein